MSAHATFFDNARKHRSNYADEKAWARHFARTYFHEIDDKPGFLTIYNALLSAGESTAAACSKGAVRVTVAPSAFAADGKQTDAEQRKGKYELNKFLYKAYNEWYEAFEDEVADEADDSSRTDSADDRWVRHAAKRLSRKSGVPADSLVPVVHAWLIQKRE